MNDAASANGLDRIRAFRDGDAAGGGMVKLIGARLVAAEFGAVSFAAEPDARHTNPGGTVHGGYLTTLLDSAIGCAATSTLGPGQFATTLELKVSFLHPCRPDGRTVTAHGTVVRPGKRVVFTEAKIIDADGRTIAIGSSTLLAVTL